MIAFRLHAAKKGRSRGSLVEMDTADLSDGDTLIDVLYAGINYKDALAGTGKAPIATRLPVNAGIEAVGRVVEGSGSFRPGQLVIAHGMGMGVERDGGLAGQVRAESDWLVPLPAGLNALEAACLGAAGYSAALAVDRLQFLGLKPGQGPVAVTGASGGVGSFAVALLAGLGHEVVAVSSKPDATPSLMSLGATEVTAAPEPSEKMLESGRWAGAIDCIGGAPLAWILRSAAPGAAIASIGNAAGNALDTSVIPFILRGITLTGINANSPPALRRRIWERLASDLRPLDPRAVARVIPPADIAVAMQQLIDNRSTGRSVVHFGGP